MSLLFYTFLDDYIGLDAPPEKYDETVRRVRDFTDRFPLELHRDGTRTVLSLEPLMGSEPCWVDDGLAATVRRICYDANGAVTAFDDARRIIVTKAALAADDWAERLAAFDARRAQPSDRASGIGHDDACLELPPEPVPLEDEGWESYAAQLGLDADRLDAQIGPLADAAAAKFARVRARYQEIYGLPLPSGLAQLAAVVAALGDLPANPEDHHWEPDPGWERGGAWLDESLGMRSAGLLDWFAPGGLERKTRDAANAHKEVPRGGEGPLDPRLDMRYRCDAPQFVTFLSGDSDGLHWGFWYDSPEYYPVIAYNYARDSGETYFDDEEEVIPLLRARTTEMLDQTMKEFEGYDEDDENRPYALRRWRALRVMGAHLDAIERWAEKRTWDPEPRCPWLRASNPVGSPLLALPPGSGTVPSTVSDIQETPSVEQRRAWMKEARRELEAGQPAYAHALGLYLHWLDADDLRDDAAKLLLEAYEALGFRPFAEILKVHVLHRDLPNVGVFEESRGPRLFAAMHPVSLPVVVRWSARARLVAAAFVVASIEFGLWVHSSPRGTLTAVLMAAGLFAASLFALVKVSLFRVTAEEEGLWVRSPGGSRRVRWEEIERVEMIAQWQEDGAIVRRATTDPAAAYHVALMLRGGGRIDLNRAMDGIDGLLEALGRKGALVLDDTIMRAAVASAAYAVARGASAAERGAKMAKVALGAAVLTFIVSLRLASTRSFALTGNIFVDMAAVAALLLGAFGSAVALARALRARRFGSPSREGEPGAGDLVLSYAAALGGPLLWIWFVPRLLTGSDEGRPIDAILVLMGLLLASVPLRAFYNHAFRR